MKFKKKTKSSTPFINTTSLVDVVFILLIFFAVSTTFFYAGGIKVELPKASSSTENPNNTVRVIITKDNMLFIDDKPVTEANLFHVLKQAYNAAEEASLVIEADTNSMHGSVVMVIDTGKLAGFEKFAIATEELK
jgi:biopolymer transport protein ExbD